MGPNGEISQQTSINSEISQQTKSHFITWKIHMHWDIVTIWRSATADSLEVARSDKQLLIVDAILSHMSNPKLKSNMTFKAKWQGDEGHPDEYQDLPWNELGNNSVIHEYLETDGMSTLIPTQFR